MMITFNWRWTTFSPPEAETETHTEGEGGRKGVSQAERRCGSVSDPVRLESRAATETTSDFYFVELLFFKFGSNF